MSRILVTGATGFVGRNLCSELAARGHQVVAAVRGESSRSRHAPRDETRLEAQSNQTLAWFPRAEREDYRIECVEIGEIGPETVWDPALLERVDTIIHLAARVHVLRESAVDPLAEFRRVNVGGTRALARAAAGHVRRFVYVSSLHAVCTLHDEPLTEATACRPDTPYGQSKLEAEQCLQAVAERQGLEVVVLRPPPVYGPGGQGNLMNLLRWLRRGWPLPLANIANRRSLIYVNNLVDALNACAEHPRAAGQTFLVSDGDDVSIGELAQRAAKALGCSARLLPVPPALMRLAGRCTGRSGAVKRLLGSLCVDDRRIRNQLSWQPPESMIDGLRATAQGMGKAA